MSRTITVGRKQINLDDKSAMVLFGALGWMHSAEADTPDNVAVQKQLKDELQKRGFKVDYGFNGTKNFDLCSVPQWPFKHAAKCCLRKGHSGEHFSNDRPGKLIYWS